MAPMMPGAPMMPFRAPANFQMNGQMNGQMQGHIHPNHMQPNPMMTHQQPMPNSSQSQNQLHGSNQVQCEIDAVNIKFFTKNTPTF